MHEDVAELVVPDLAEKGALAAERGEPRDRVGAGTARHFDGGAHLAVKRVGAFRIDQRHAALLDAVRGQESVVCVGNHIDERVADARHVILELCHDPLEFFQGEFRSVFSKSASLI